MGTFENLTNRLRSERRVVPIQTSISAADSDTLDELVDFFCAHGAPTTRANTVRALVLDGLEEFRNFLKEHQAAVNPERNIK